MSHIKYKVISALKSNYSVTPYCIKSLGRVSDWSLMASIKCSYYQIIAVKHAFCIFILMPKLFLLSLIKTDLNGGPKMTLKEIMMV